MMATINDTVVVNVNNQLGTMRLIASLPSKVLTKRLPPGNQTTTLHFHGIYQNGTTDMDGAAQVGQCGIAPGSRFTYNFTVS